MTSGCGVTTGRLSTQRGTVGTAPSAYTVFLPLAGHFRYRWDLSSSAAPETYGERVPGVAPLRNAAPKSAAYIMRPVSGRILRRATLTRSSSPRRWPYALASRSICQRESTQHSRWDTFLSEMRRGQSSFRSEMPAAPFLCFCVLRCSLFACRAAPGLGVCAEVGVLGGKHTSLRALCRLSAPKQRHSKLREATSHAALRLTKPDPMVVDALVSI